MKIDPQLESSKITSFIVKTFSVQGFSKAIIAVSGGVDSALSLALTSQAIAPNNIYTLQLPYQDQSITRSNATINHLKIPLENRIIFNLQDTVSGLSTKLEVNDKLRLGNLMARTRMIYLFDQAKKLDALVVGTENKSENLLGYFTRFGDAASDLEPLGHLYKTQVFDLAKHLNVPEEIINQPPSAGLWVGQTDQSELGFTYDQADPILSLYVDYKLDKSSIVAKGYDQQLVDKVISRVSQNKFKHLTPYHI